MKHHPQRNHPARQGMTLVELLVVISIIGVLAGLILPAVGNVKKKAKVVQAQKDMADLKGAINVYQHDYNRLPSSTAASQALPGSDFTYGTAGTGYGTNIVNNNGTGYQASNAELMLILTAATSFPNYTTNTANTGDAKNPRKTQYFNGKPAPGGSGATAGAGIGTDGVFRDPWSNPYVVALDLNYDGSVSNSVYNADVVSNAGGGLVRLGAAGTSTWVTKDSVMVFSFGPDGMFDGTKSAGADPNKDNVLSWK